jgi:hypothetical protein
MNFSEVYVYEKPVYKATFYKKINNKLRHLYIIINYYIFRNSFEQKFEKTRIKNSKIVLAANIIGMHIEDARKKIPKTIICVVKIGENGEELCEQDYCNGRVNVLINERNIITKIMSFE